MNDISDGDGRGRRRSFSVTLGVALIVIALAGALLWMRGGGGSDDGGDWVELQVGDTAPPFSLPGAGGGLYTLDELTVQKKVLLYFSMGPG